MARPGGITLAEIAGAGIWLASTVEVFSFTYKAFHDTYVPFPIGTGVGAADKPVHYDPAHPKGPAASVVGGETPGSMVVLQGLTAHAPAAIVSTISTLYNQKQPLDPGVQRLFAWARKHYGNSDLVSGPVDVWKGVVTYVDHGWPGGKYKFDLVGPDPKNPVRIVNSIAGTAWKIIAGAFG